MALDLVHDGVLIADMVHPGAAAIYANRAFEAITGYSNVETLGKNCRYLQGGDRLQPEIAEIRAAIEAHRPAHVTLRNYRKDGTLFWNELRLQPVFNSAGLLTHYIGVIRDVTRLRETSTQLEHATHLDPLTGVANRYAFLQGVEDLRGGMDGGHLFVAKIDIVRFHEINTSYGYDLGDALLAQVATRLRSVPGLIIGRMGSNEFSVATRCAAAADAERLMPEIQQVLARAFTLPGTTIDVRFGFGFTITDAETDALTLMRQSGAALYRSKTARPQRPQRFDAETEKEIRNRVSLTRELHRAVVDGEFSLYCQPQVNLSSGTIAGVEALVRWEHPVFGLQTPDRFIKLADETGLLLEIDAWMLRRTAEMIVRINRGRAVPLTASVNFSCTDFVHRDVVALVRKVAAETGAEPTWLVLELTEGLMAEKSPALTATFHALRALGVGLSIDDFGTGYSNLQYLEAFPLSEIKLDKAFVREFHGSATKRAVAEAVVRIGRALGVRVIAEGIETAEQAAQLQDIGYDWGQGYFFGCPVEQRAFETALAQDREQCLRSAAPHKLPRCDHPVNGLVYCGDGAAHRATGGGPGHFTPGQSLLTIENFYKLDDK